MAKKFSQSQENNGEFTHKGWNFRALCNAAGLPANIENITDPNYALYGNGYMDHSQEPFNFICSAESLDRVGDILEIQTNMRSTDPETQQVVLYFHWDKNPEVENKWTGSKGPGREFTLEDLYFSPSQARESWEADEAKARDDSAAAAGNDVKEDDEGNFLVLPDFVGQGDDEIVDAVPLDNDLNDPLAGKKT